MSAEFDLINALSDDRERRVAAISFLEKLKTAAKKEKEYKPPPLTEKDRAHAWGAMGGLAGSVGSLIANREVSDWVVRSSKTTGGAVAKAIAVPLGISAAGYGVGRLAHRLVHGKATDKKIKMSGVKDVAKDIGATVLKKALQHKVPLVGAGLGAGLGYLASRPGKDGKPSYEQRSRQAALKDVEREKRDLKATGKEPSFKQSIDHAVAPAAKKISDALAKHPSRGAIAGAGAGALTASQLAKAFNFVKNKL